MFLKFLPEKIKYTGKELRPHWIANTTGQFGSAIVAFCGACEVKTNEMVDLVDRHAGETIVAREMLHFIAEDFSDDLAKMILKQRLFISHCLDQLRSRVPVGIFNREGNDLFWTSPQGERKKLSVAIATASPVSVLFHFAINVDGAGAPVPVVGLKDFGIEVGAFVESVFVQWDKELKSLDLARCKVAPRV